MVGNTITENSIESGQSVSASRYKHKIGGHLDKMNNINFIAQKDIFPALLDLLIYSWQD